MISQAVILTHPPHDSALNGEGSVIQPVVGKPWLIHLLRDLERHGIHEFITIISRTHEDGAAIVDLCREFAHSHPNCLFHHYPLETDAWTTLRMVESQLADHLLIVDAWILPRVNHLQLGVAIGAGSGAMGCILKEEPTEPHPRLSTLLPPATAPETLITERLPGGVATLRREVLAATPDAESPFTHLLAQGKLRVLFTPTRGVRLAELDHTTLEPAVTNWQHRSAILFDRDGVLNADVGYLHQASEFRWVCGAVSALKWCNDNGYLALVVTNQSGIGRGMYSLEQFQEFTAWINSQLRLVGAHIDATYFCPHHPSAAQGEYQQECSCRKPSPGLILQALAEWRLDPARVIMIGDKSSDLEAAAAAGIPGHLFPGGNLKEFMLGLRLPAP